MYKAFPRRYWAGLACGISGAVYCEQTQPSTLKFVGKKSDFAEGTIKEVKFPYKIGKEPQIVAVAKVQGKIYIVGASCSHYSAPLGDGIVDGLSVVCPWHDAAFDLETGQPVRGPVLDAIPTFEVVEQGDEIYCHYLEGTPDFVKPKMAKADASDSRVFAIVGGGAAAAACMEALRSEGYTGGIVMLSNEDHPPVDTPVLSKNVKKKKDEIYLRPSEYYLEELDVKMHLNETVEKIDPEEKVIQTDKSTIKYDKCLVCTGSSPRRLTIPNGDQAHVIRKTSDTEKLDLATNNQESVVIIGSSFIGIELCTSLVRKKCKVTVVGMEAVPFERVLGPQIGAALLKFIESKGVTFIPKSNVISIKTNKESKVTGVELDNGRVVAGHVCVFACGATPNSSVVDVAKHPDGGIVTSAKLETSCKDLYAAGDVAAFEVDGRVERIEHWDTAFWHGRLAGKLMATDSCSECCTDIVPFFWTSVFGKNLRYIGYGRKYDSIHIDGDLDSLRFVCYYFRGNEVSSVCTMAKDPIASCVGKLLKYNKMPRKSEIIKPGFDSLSLLQLCHEA